MTAPGAGHADGLSLTSEERARIAASLGRAPRPLELSLFDVQWSEHCSYKSSRALLGRLPTAAPTVILGPGEDAGILRLPDWGGRSWGLVVAHESHNHPSQVVPEEGAATGVGGIVRDVSCMGAEVFAVLDGLRFGDPAGPRGGRVREIAQGVVAGIRGYGNAIGVPNLGGDAVFHPSFDENVLVNVVAAGLVPSDAVVSSAVPEEARTDDFVLILVGKPTDWSGMGGATLASRVLDAARDESDRGAVQAADPFLKRVLFEANRELFERFHAAKIPFGMKDLGAGGIGGMSAEIAAKGGFGMEVDLDRVPTVDPDLPPEVIACAETQERFGIVVPAHAAAETLAIYNETFALPHVHRGARAAVIGRVLGEPLYRMVHRAAVVAEIPIAVLVEGIRAERSARPRARSGEGSPAGGAPVPAPGADGGHLDLLAKLLASVHLASREPVFRYYDTEVGGRAVLRPGEADAAILRPLPDAPWAVAFSLDGNPRLGACDPRAAGRSAVCEGVRNVVAAGATPLGLTDCLNFGSPEDPEVYWDFTEAVEGLAEAARAMGLRDHPGSPLPFVSGNVSFYNQSVSGRAIAPSPIVGTFGLLEEIGLATTLALKGPGHALLLVGPRGAEMAGSLHAESTGRGGAGPCAPVDLPGEAARARAVEAAIREGLVLAAHDISEGGLLGALAEMALAAPPARGLGVRVGREAFPAGLPDEAVLWNEAGGYLLEARPEEVERLAAVARDRGAGVVEIGRTTDDGTIALEGFGRGAERAAVAALRQGWERGLGTLFGAYGRPA